MEEALQKEVEAMIAGATKGLTDQVGLLTKAVEPVSGLEKQLKELSDNVNVVANTVKDQKPIDVNDLIKQAQVGVLQAIKDQGAADADKAAKAKADADARKAIVEKLTNEKLGGNADLAGLLVGDDEAALTASAEKIAATVKSIKPDFGGAARDGGKVPSQQADDKSKLPPVERIAAGMK